MTVKELKAALDNYPDDTPVYYWDHEYSSPWDYEMEVQPVAEWSYTVDVRGETVRRHMPAGITLS